MAHPTPQPGPDDERTLTVRKQTHERIVDQLEASSDRDLLRLLSDRGIGAKGCGALTLPDSEAPVFVKLLPLTDLEMQPEHHGTTANVFGLPSHYHYRIGTCGFGAWRDLAVHRVANEWVLSGQSACFPLLHHFRVLPVLNHNHNDKTTLEPWGGSPSIRERVSSVVEATRSAVLFLEHFPLTLSQRLDEQLRQDPDPVSVVTRVETMLLEVLEFIRERGLLHLDAHFENVLTDGNQVFLCDFELALSESFQLESEERAFFETHQNFDLCTSMTSLVHAIVTHYDSVGDWRQTLRKLRNGTSHIVDAMPVALRSFVIRRAPVALAIGDVYRRLRVDVTTPYPAARLEALLSDIRANPG